MAKKIVLSKEQLSEINDCYINKLWSSEQICTYFGFSATYFKRLIKDNLIQRKTEEQRQKTMKKTTEERYGDPNYRNAVQAKKTCLEKYGDENYRNGNQVSKTKIEKFKDPSIKEDFLLKTKQSKLERYGNENFNNSKQISKTKQEKFSTDEEYKESILLKSKQTRLEKYGDENYRNPEQISTSLKERYSDPKKKLEFRTKIKQTNLERYGNENFNNRELCKKTLKEKYGNENYFNRQKSIENTLLKYGTEYPSQKNIQYYDIWNDKNKFIDYIKSNSNQTYFDLAKHFNVDRTTINQRIIDYDLQEFIKISSGMSHYEYEIKDYLIAECGISEDEIVMHDKSIIAPLEIDIYLPKYKFGIEFNGNYWHCDEQVKFQDHNGRSIWHQKKSLLAEEKGIFLFHIFEYEWNNPVEQQNIKSRLKTLLLKNCCHIPARKCSIIELTKDQKKNFLNINHIQGNDHSTKHYGLLYQNEIVACMTFVKPKNKKYTWELSRFCVKNNCVVQGGASKLFTHFTKSLNKGDMISSYNDITKTKGELYKILGFKCVSINNPNYVWMNFTTNDIRTRYQEQEAGEVERMHSLGYHRICDCGTRTWVYTIE